MPNLRELIRDSKSVKKELVATTVRMTKEVNSFIEGLTEQLALSKQEVILKLIEEGIKIAQDELKLDESDNFDDNENCSFYLLNTNKRHNIDDQEVMIKRGIAAAYYDPWKYSINHIKKGDVVFLYGNGEGIVAYGKGTGNTIKEDKDGYKDECHYQQLESFTVLEKPLPAHEIRKILNGKVIFLRTMSSLSDGQKILDTLIS